MISKEQILITASELFMYYGIKTITMDDIAKELSISKRTLYTVFKSKQLLVSTIVSNHIESQRSLIGSLTCIKNGNAIDKMLRNMKFIISMYNKLHKNVLFDLQKFYPEIWKIVDKFQCDFVKNKLENNMLEGKKEGLYREEIEPKILASFYTKQLQLFSDQSNFNLEIFNFTDYLNQMFEYHLYGILSYKGVKYYLNIEKNINI